MLLLQQLPSPVRPSTVISGLRHGMQRRCLAGLFAPEKDLNFPPICCAGQPVMRPLWFEFPAAASLFGVDDEFMLGPALLAAPVLDEGVTSRSVTLPAGPLWYDAATGATAGSTDVVLGHGHLKCGAIMRM